MICQEPQIINQSQRFMRQTRSPKDKARLTKERLAVHFPSEEAMAKELVERGIPYEVATSIINEQRDYEVSYLVDISEWFKIPLSYLMGEK